MGGFGAQLPQTVDAVVGCDLSRGTRPVRGDQANRRHISHTCAFRNIGGRLDRDIERLHERDEGRHAVYVVKRVSQVVSRYDAPSKLEA